MTAVHKIGQAGYRGPSIFKEIMYGLTAGLIAGGLWKRYHWNLQRRNKEFYDMLERGEISVVVVVASRIRRSTLLQDGGARDSQHIRVLDPVVTPAKRASRQDVRTHPPMVLLAMEREGYMRDS